PGRLQRRDARRARGGRRLHRPRGHRGEGPRRGGPLLPGQPRGPDRQSESRTAAGDQGHEGGRGRVSLGDARRQGRTDPGEARPPRRAARSRGLPARTRRPVLAGRRLRALHRVRRRQPEEGALGARGATDDDRDPSSAGRGPRGTGGAHRRDDQRARRVRRSALRSRHRRPHRVPDAEHARGSGVGLGGEARRRDPGAEQAQRHVRAPRPDAPRAGRGDRRAGAREDHLGMSGHGKGERRANDRRGFQERRTRDLPPPHGVERRASADRRARDRRSAGQRLDVILDVTRRLMAVTDLDALLHTMAEATADLLAANRATIYVVDRERDELWSRVALGAGEIRFPIGTGIAGSVARSGETINIADAYKDARFNPEPDRLSGYRTKSLLTFPMKGNEGRVIGVFQVVNKRGGGPFTATDEETLAALGASAAVAVENAQLIAEQKRLWRSLIETLAVTVDARDQQTAGHSQRVTRYAAVIGKAMGWGGKEIEKLQAAALLHDYGKIAVRDQFLQKPGKLDEAELAYMKAHAEKTGEFLAHLVFPHDMREVPLIAAQHHERMDGKGYPKG